MSETMAVQEHLYDVAGQITKTIDFGVDLKVAERTPSPPQGLRFNFDWQAELTGARIKGKIAGTNYVYTRADGVTFINSQGVLTTPEGDRIAVHTEGISTRQEGSPVFQERENIQFYTACPRYAWVNRLQCWATGSVDLSTGRIAMKVYTA
jgi:hypothetical protein